MESLLKSDVFFFITGIAVIILTAVGLVVLFLMVKIFRTIRGIVKTVKTETEHVVEDIEEYRKDIKQGEQAIKYAAKKIGRFFK